MNLDECDEGYEGLLNPKFLRPTKTLKEAIKDFKKRNCNILIIPRIVSKPTMNRYLSRPCVDLFFHTPIHFAYRQRQLPL